MINLLETVVYWNCYSGSYMHSQFYNYSFFDFIKLYSIVNWLQYGPDYAKVINESANKSWNRLSGKL